MGFSHQQKQRMVRLYKSGKSQALYTHQVLTECQIT